MTGRQTRVHMPCRQIKLQGVALSLATGLWFFGAAGMPAANSPVPTADQPASPAPSAPAGTNAGQPKPPSAYYDSAGQRFVYLADGKLKAVETQADWALCRKLIIRNIEEVMGPLPDASRRVPLDMKVLATFFISPSETNLPKLVMRKISFATETNDYREAWLLAPLGVKGPRPAMLCLHQSNYMLKDEPAGLSGYTNFFYARELAEQGYVTLAPDYQEYPYAEPRRPQNPYRNLGYASYMMKGVWNHMRAVDLLQSLPEVDPQRIGCIGHSLGGMNTLWVAAFDDRIKAAVISGGISTFRKPMAGGKGVADWARELYMPRVASVYANNPDKIPFDFTGVLACLAPRPVLINAPTQDYISPSGARDCAEAAKTVYALFNAADRITVLHPQTHHTFPPEVRKAFYEKLAVVLEPSKPP